MKNILKKAGLFFIILFITFQSKASDSKLSFIHRNHKTLIDSTGKTIKLRGVDLGGWLLWEEWIWGGGFKSENTILDNLSEIIGKDEAYKFQDSVHHDFITEADIKEIAHCGFNVVRMPFNCRIFGYGDSVFNYRAYGWKIVDSLISWCKKYDIYVIPDMHSAPGGQTPWFTADPEEKSSDRLWNSTLRQQQTLTLWKAIAQRYASNKTIAGYDLINEPGANSNKQLVDFYKEIIGSIRKEDSVHMMVVEGGGFATKFDFFTSLPDSNMAFSFHQYTWFGENPEKKVAEHKTLAERLDVPLWCGEFGENKYDIVQKTVAIYERPENHISGWAYWTWKKVPNGYNSLCGIVKTDSWDKLVKWMQHPNKYPKPTKEETEQGITSFLKSCRFQNCIMDNTMMSILKPQ